MAQSVVCYFVAGSAQKVLVKGHGSTNVTSFHRLDLKAYLSSSIFSYPFGARSCRLGCGYCPANPRRASRSTATRPKSTPRTSRTYSTTRSSTMSQVDNARPNSQASGVSRILEYVSSSERRPFPPSATPRPCAHPPPHSTTGMEASASFTSSPFCGILMRRATFENGRSVGGFPSFERPEVCGDEEEGRRALGCVKSPPPPGSGITQPQAHLF